MIMGDPYFGHRHYRTGEPLKSRSKDEFTAWDYALIRAFQVVEDFTDKHGLLVWETDSDRVMVNAVKKQDKFQAAIDRLTNKKNYKSSPGEVFAPKLELRGGEWPTFTEYIERQAKNGTIEG